MYRTHPQTHEILKLVKEHFQDNKVLISSSFGFNAPVPEDHRLRNPDLAGGAILDVGCYPLSMARLIAGTIDDKPFLDPISMEVSGELDSTGVDADSTAKITFNDKIQAEIKTAIVNEYANDLIIESSDSKLEVSQPWHCGQFQDGKSSIKLTSNNKESEIPIVDDVGLFTREINEASDCILQGNLESEAMSHKDTFGNMLWLERWYVETGVKYPQNTPQSSPIFSYDYSAVENIKKSAFEEISKEGSRIVFGCDNQTSQLHASTMFDHFYRNGGNIFDTAYIYNFGKSDKYLGEWIKTNDLSKDVMVLGKGAHTPDCEPKFIKPQLEESLDRLMLDRMDIYCLHRDNADIPSGEFIDALNEVRDEDLYLILAHQIGP